MPPTQTASTQPPLRFAVVGNPIAQSRSPEIHRQFAHACGIHLHYERLLAPREGFVETLEAFRASGGLGINVTAPFKIEACAYAQRHSVGTRLAGAANALRFAPNGDVQAENFDGPGLVRDIQVNHGLALHGKNILLLGAGGAARGVVLPLLREGPASLHIANRSPAPMERLVDVAAKYKMAALGMASAQRGAHGDIGHSAIQGHVLSELAPGRVSPNLRYDVVINCTSAALHGAHDDGAWALAPSLFGHCQLACELSYGRGLTPFLRQAQNAGAAQCIDGTGMLVEQAALSFHWWHGVHPQTGPVIRALLQQSPPLA